MNLVTAPWGGRGNSCRAQGSAGQEPRRAWRRRTGLVANACNLVDEYVLSIHPPILGSGRRLFDDASSFARLELVSATPTTTGVVIATYRPFESAAG